MTVAAGVVGGIFIGGRASRMGGRAKGLFASPDGGEPIIVRTRRVLEEAGVTSCVLVGRGGHADYAASAASASLPILDDDERATGPLAGILALLEHAQQNDSPFVIAVACDMPLFTRDIVKRLLTASPLNAPIVAFRHDGIWEPLFARYSPSLALPFARTFASEGGRKLQLLLDTAKAHALELTKEEERMLVDWDSPEDVQNVQDV